MSATDLAMIVLVVVSLASIATLAVLAARLSRVLEDMEVMKSRFEAQSSALIGDLEEQAVRVGGLAEDAAREVQRLDDIIHTTGHVVQTVDAATSATFRVLANPVIRGAAVATGTGRAARRLRGGRR